MGAAISMEQEESNKILVNTVKASAPLLVSYALQQGADPNTTCSWETYNDEPVLLLAVASDDIDVVEVLLDNETIDVDKRVSLNLTPLYNAVGKENVDIVQLLLSKDADPDLLSGQPSTTPLLSAVLNGNEEIAALLLMHKASPDLPSGQPISTPLLQAIARDKLDMAALLLGHGASVDLALDSYTPLFEAVVKINISMAEMLLKNGASPDLVASEDLQTPLYQSVLSGKLSMVKLLLENNASSNLASGKLIRPPLVEAALDGHLDICSLLLEHGANPFALDNNGFHSLYCAVQGGHYEVAKLILNCGGKASVDLVATAYRRTPLIEASLRGQLDICNLLLQNGANPNATDNEGMYSIYLAAQEGHQDVIRLLIEFGGDPHLPRFGTHDTAAVIARQQGHGELAKWLGKQKKLKRQQNSYCETNACI